MPAIPLTLPPRSHLPRQTATAIVRRSSEIATPVLTLIVATFCHPRSAGQGRKNGVGSPKRSEGRWLARVGDRGGCRRSRWAGSSPCLAGPVGPRGALMSRGLHSATRFPPMQGSSRQVRHPAAPRASLRAASSASRWSRRAMAIRALAWFCFRHGWSSAGFGGFDPDFRGFAGTSSVLPEDGPDPGTRRPGTSSGRSGSGCPHKVGCSGRRPRRSRPNTSGSRSGICAVPVLEADRGSLGPQMAGLRSAKRASGSLPGGRGRCASSVSWGRPRSARSRTEPSTRPGRGSPRRGSEIPATRRLSIRRSCAVPKVRSRLAPSPDGETRQNHLDPQLAQRS